MYAVVFMFGCSLPFARVGNYVSSDASKLGDVLNVHRVKQSSLATPPKKLHLNRHLFVVSGIMKQVHKTPVERVTQTQVTVILPDKAKSMERSLAVLEEPQTMFNWDMRSPVKTPISKEFQQGAGKLSKGVIYNIYTKQIVYSPIAGKVIYAGSMEGFGYVVMIERDVENIVLVAGISNTSIKQGQRLDRGQKLGTVIKGDWIYLEFRHEGIPVDPKLVLMSG